MRDGHLRGVLSRPATQRQMDVLAAFVAAGGSVPDAAELVGIRPSTVKRHLADLRARSGLTTEQLIYAGRAGGWLVVPSWSPTETGFAFLARQRTRRWTLGPLPPRAHRREARSLVRAARLSRRCEGARDEHHDRHIDHYCQQAGAVRRHRLGPALGRTLVASA